MTREITFRIDFETQLAAFTGWIVSRETDLQKLAPSDYPSFVVELGETTIITYDSTGRPVSGRQLFTLTLRNLHSQLAVNASLQFRSDAVTRIETFFGGGHVTPAIAPGDAERIDGIVLLKIDPSPMRRSDTRLVLRLQCAYDFTMF